MLKLEKKQFRKNRNFLYFFLFNQSQIQLRIGPYHDAFAELFYFLTTAPFLRGCVRNNLKYISFEDCKLPPRGVGNVSLNEIQQTVEMRYFVTSEIENCTK